MFTWPLGHVSTLSPAHAPPKSQAMRSSGGTLAGARATAEQAEEGQAHGSESAHSDKSISKCSSTFWSSEHIMRSIHDERFIMHVTAMDVHPCASSIRMLNIREGGCPSTQKVRHGPREGQQQTKKVSSAMAVSGDIFSRPFLDDMLGST